MKTFHIIVIGCQMNKADGERIAGLLEVQGLKLEKNRAKADLVILVTCGVRQSAEDRIFGLIPRIKKENPKAKIMLTGCLSYREDVKKRVGGFVDYWVNIGEISNFKFQISNKISNTKNQNIDNCSYLKQKPLYNSKFTAYVPIGNGCDNFCSYCVVPYARGREAYRLAEDILDEVRSLVASGYKEIILIAQNVNSYKSQITITNNQKNSKFKISKTTSNKVGVINFTQLLRMANDVPGDFWIRFATSHPKDMSGDLIKAIAECEKVCEHIHLPVQAGDDEVLRRMNRKYTAAHYLELIDKIKSSIKMLIYSDVPICKKSKVKSQRSFLPATITTDTIVGFPGETSKQFLNTVKLYKQVKYDMAYVVRYSPRPGTVSAKMEDDVSLAEKKKREEELMKILRKTALANSKKYLKKTVDILIYGKNKKGEHYGYTRTFKNVNCIGGNGNLTGQFVKVKITKAQDFGLEGEIVN